MHEIISNWLLRALCLFFILKQNKNGKTTNSHHDSPQNAMKLNDPPLKHQHSSPNSSFLDQIPLHSPLNTSKVLLHFQTPVFSIKHHDKNTNIIRLQRFLINTTNKHRYSTKYQNSGSLGNIPNSKIRVTLELRHHFLCVREPEFS